MAHDVRPRKSFTLLFCFLLRYFRICRSFICKKEDFKVNQHSNSIKKPKHLLQPYLALYLDIFSNSWLVVVEVFVCLCVCLSVSLCGKHYMVVLFISCWCISMDLILLMSQCWSHSVDKNICGWGIFTLQEMTDE